MQPIIQTKNVLAILDQAPTTKGHVRITPIEETIIFEQATDEVAAELFSVANELSSTLFEILQAKGSNLLIQNGQCAGQDENQLSLQVIPRFEEDGLNMVWQSEPASEEDLLESQKIIQEALLAKPKDPKEIEVEQEEQKNKDKWIKDALFRLP